ncbi:MAG: hypothetical protein HGA28_07310 [Anaerolineaceae bacterium]|nr:hypothetical protein [Anaerolineaceae bacterium]
MQIEWNPPEPRGGWRGEWDKFVGPGQTRAELWLILVPSLLAGLAAPLYAHFSGLGWTTLQIIVAGVIALDLVGGVVTNATTAAKRWYHRPGQSWRQQLAFISVHFIHLFLVAWLFLKMDWMFFIGFYTYLIAASLIITRVRLYLQRPVALLLFLGVLLLAFYMSKPVPGLEWFIPVFFLKLLVSHLPKEAPFSVDIPA